MVRKLGRVAAGVAAAVGMVVVSAGMLSADDTEKNYSIEEIMKKGHGSKGLLKGITAEVKTAKWDDAKNDAKLLKAFGVALGKNKPPRGAEASWKKLTEQYKENTVAVAKAVDKKDAKATTDALGKIGKSCKGCHDNHKE
jgi:cytochrome c556